MSPEEYSSLCDRILTETMKYIKTDNMRKRIIKDSHIKSRDPIYISAATSGSPITIVYTPVGSGKSALIADHIKGLMLNGTHAENIAVLSMNIAKAKQTALDIPGITSMTFSDFTHQLFITNRPDYELVDDNTIINELKLQEQTPFCQALLNKLTIKNPKDRNCLLTVFINNHTNETEAELAKIHKISYTLESMICQNRLYEFTYNPFCLEEIIVNGVHNMPLHTLCCLLEYASVLGCNLFFTGMPDETIYEFNMAYGNAMNMLSSYMNHLDISVIHLSSTKMADDIKNTLLQTDNVTIHSDYVKTSNLIIKYEDDEKMTIQNAIAKSLCNYIDKKLAKKEQVLIIAKSKSEINAIKSVILETKNYDCQKITDLTAIQPPVLLWGTVLVKYANTLKTTYPNGLTKIMLYDNLWKYLSQEINLADSKRIKDLYIQSQNSLYEKVNTAWTENDMMEKPVLTRILEIIHEESQIMEKHNNYIKDCVSIDLSISDIIFSTIHSATDIRCDNVIVYLRNFSDKIDENLYRIALSRANNTEYLIFANSGNFEIPVQRYLKYHLNKQGD